MTADDGWPQRHGDDVVEGSGLPVCRHCRWIDDGGVSALPVCQHYRHTSDHIGMVDGGGESAVFRPGLSPILKPTFWCRPGRCGRIRGP